MKRPLISIVIPVFNEQPNVDPCYQALQSILKPLDARYEFEFVFTDNHSTDLT